MNGPLTDGFAEAAAETVARIREAAQQLDDEPTQGNAPILQDKTALQTLSPDVRQIRDQLLNTGLHGVMVTWSSAEDHLRTLENDLRRQPRPIWSTMSVARAVLESMVFTCYITQAGLSVDERLARIAAMWLQDVNYLVQVTPPKDPGRQEALKEKKFRHDELRRGGFTLQPANEPTTVRLGMKRASVKLNTTDRASLLFPKDAPAPYRLASGAAHSRPWFLTMNATETAGQWTGNLATAASAVITSAYAMKAGAKDLSAYLGRTAGEAEEQINGALKNLLKLAADELGLQIPDEPAPAS